MPKLTGVVQVDETFIRDQQKGSRDLVSYIDNSDTREIRYSYYLSTHSNAEAYLLEFSK